MLLSVLTCNTLFGKAIGELNEIAKKNKVDVVSLQEVETEEENLKQINGDDYLLADFSNSFIQFNQIFGLATYYRKDSLSFNESENFGLTRSLPETLMMFLRVGRSERTVLKTEFTVKSTGKKLTVYNIHCSSWSTNKVRDRQIQQLLSDLQTDFPNPTIIMGDFNYPYGRRKFEKLISRYGLKEATNNIFYSYEFKLFGFIPIKWKNDYILYKNLILKETKRLKINSSDHYPIISTFET